MSSSFILPSRPLPLPINRTCVFKTANGIPIHIDVYLPPPSPTSSTYPNDETSTLKPLVLFIHGGGWSGSNRGDYSRPLFRHFLDAGFVVTSMDYRLVPESSNLHQLEDVKDVEEWLRKGLPVEIGAADGDAGDEVRKIVVVGASAGGQLALLVPKLWNIPPTAMLLFYPPTNMHELPYSGRGRISALTLPPPTHALLEEATDFEAPPTQRAIPKCALDYLGPRVVMSTHIFRGELISEFLLRGLNGSWPDDECTKCNDYGGTEEKMGEVMEVAELRLPEKGSVGVQEVDEISPLHYLTSIPHHESSKPYPPTYLLTGTTDEVFAPESHALPFYHELQRQGVPSEIRLVNGLGHAFDVWAEIGGWIGEEILRGAVEWVERWVR